MEINFVKLNLT